MLSEDHSGWEIQEVDQRIINMRLAGILDLYAQNPNCQVLDLSTIMENEYLSKELSSSWNGLESRDVSELEAILKQERSKLPSEVSVVDYGPGSGWKGAEVCKILKNLGIKVRFIHHIDNSPDVLSQAGNYCENQGLSVVTHKQVKFEDLGELTELRKDHNYKLYLFLGQTIGNTTQARRVIRNFAANMREREWLLVEWFLNQPEDYKPLEKFYRDYLQKVLHFPVEAIGEYEPVTDTKKEWNLMQFRVNNVPEGQRIVTVGNKDYTLKPETKVIVSRSKRFGERELIRTIERNGYGVKDVMITTEEVVTLDEGLPYTGKRHEYLTWREKDNKRYALFEKTRDFRKTPLWRYLVAIAAVPAAIMAYSGANYWSIEARQSDQRQEYTYWEMLTETICEDNIKEVNVKGKTKRAIVVNSEPGEVLNCQPGKLKEGLDKKLEEFCDIGGIFTSLEGIDSIYCVSIIMTIIGERPYLTRELPHGEANEIIQLDLDKIVEARKVFIQGPIKFEIAIPFLRENLPRYYLFGVEIRMDDGKEHLLTGTVNLHPITERAWLAKNITDMLTTYIKSR